MENEEKVQTVCECGCEEKAVCECGCEEKAVCECGCEEKAVSECGCEEKAVCECGCEEKAVSECGCEEKAVCECGCEEKTAEAACDCAAEKEAETKPARQPRPVIEVTDEMLEETRKRLCDMLDFLGLEGTVKAEKRPSKVNLLVSSNDAGRIIGRKGQALESLQLLLNRMMQKVNIDFPKIYIDIDGYSSKQPTPPPAGKTRRERGPREGGFRRERSFRGERGHRFENSEEKEDILRQQALDAAKEVRHWGEPVTLPLMNSHDRRIIHVTLEEAADVKTESIGEGPLKQVVISPKN